MRENYWTEKLSVTSEEIQNNEKTIKEIETFLSAFPKRTGLVLKKKINNNIIALTLDKSDELQVWQAYEEGQWYCWPKANKYSTYGEYIIGMWKQKEYEIIQLPELKNPRI